MATPAGGLAGWSSIMQTLTTPVPVDRRPDDLRVVFALTALEQAAFIPAADPELRPSLIDPATLATPGQWHALLDELRPAALVTCWKTPALPGDWLLRDDCPLRYVCHLSGSVRRLVPRVFLERGGLVTNWGGLVASQVAEHALLLALASLRRLPDWNTPEVLTDKNRILSLTTKTLFKRRVGIHGCGGVARRLSALLRPFECEITCWSEGAPDHLMHGAGMTPAASLDALFSHGEVVFECEALTPRNAASVGPTQLSLLPDGALFINVGRGQLVDEPALLREALSGRIHVALDVMLKEPPPPDSPWWTIPGALLSPHVAGPTHDMLPRIGARAMDNLARFLSGQLPLDPLTLEIYDRTT
ncbi:MAG TPA: NAD(P)-dependent oxidoreductase [Rariglobus sp.]